MLEIEEFVPSRARGFELWLAERLSADIERNEIERNRLCDFEHLDIPMGDSFLDSIANLFHAMPKSRQELFREGLVDLFCHAREPEFSADGMGRLMYLIAITETYAGLEAFASVLGRADWEDERPRLIYDALSVIGMFENMAKAYNAAKSLSTAIYFEDRFVFEVYTVLIRARPQKWFTDLRELSARFQRLWAHIDSQGSAEERRVLEEKKQELAWELSRIPLSNLAAHLGSLSLKNGVERELLARLLGILELVADPYDRYRLVDREDSARTTAAKPPPADVLIFATDRGLIRHEELLEMAGEDLEEVMPGVIRARPGASIELARVNALLTGICRSSTPSIFTGRRIGS